MKNGTTTFWQDTGKSMGIYKDRTETDLSFCCRVMVSALSKWALTTVGGPNGSVSIVRVQQVLEEKLSGYLKLLPTNDTICLDGIVADIYKLLLENGAFYLMQHNVRPTPHKLIRCRNISLIRGMAPEERVCFSGLAPFVMDSAESNSLSDEFLLWPLSGEETLDLVWRRSTPVDSGINLEEYLNVERTSGKYYTSRKKSNWSFSLARNRQPGNMYNFDYYIIMGNETRHIPNDYLEASIHEYVRLAMMNKNKKQAVTATIKEQTVSIDLGYMLPAPELRFIRYVSWPANINDSSNAFSFTLQPVVWPTIKERLTSLGYEVNETHD